ncbi:uncharacterized protein LOC143287618 [Babylonia areolata]|uniref:uncharacterized protein LOC143287618 n=1 Tax=Babylonia areolata TaxID=304850 RepID=UPI003FD331F0
MMLRLFVFLGVVASVCYASSIHDCPANLPRNRYLRAFGNRCYQFVLGHLKEFNPAERECRQKGGHLAIIRNQRTQNFLYDTLWFDLDYYGDVWIGLTDQESEGDYVWVDGSPANFTYWGENWSHEHKDCVGMHVYYDGRWFDYGCSDGVFYSNHLRFICEFPLVPPTTQPPTTQPPTTQLPTTQPPTTQQPTTQLPTTQPPTTQQPTTQLPTTQQPTTQPPTTQPPTTQQPTTQPPTTQQPTTQAPTTQLPTTQAPTTPQPTTSAPEQSTSAAATTTVPKGGCPPFNCDVDCGLSGYKVDDNGCLICQCEE